MAKTIVKTNCPVHASKIIYHVTGRRVDLNKLAIDALFKNYDKVREEYIGRYRTNVEYDFHNDSIVITME